MRHARRRVTWQGVALVVGTVTAGSVLVNLVPQGTVVEEPFLVAGTVGETTDLGYAELTVTQVRTADTLGSVLETAVAGGTFLVVDATWRATEGATIFAGVEVVDTRGRTFWPTTRGGCATGTSAQPGYAWRVTYCFDVPRDALEGATVRLARGGQTEDHAGQRRDAVALIDLGIGAREADELWDASETVEPESPGYATATDGADEG